MSHSLSVEAGRRSRTPPDMRMCDCDQDGVQAEERLVGVLFITDPETKLQEFRLYHNGNFDGGEG